MLKGKNILIVSNEPWGETWYSKHNYAWELSTKNNVLFINPGTQFKPWNIFTKNVRVKNIKENLSVLDYKNILPVRFEFTRLINEWYILKKTNKYLKKNKINDIIFWTFDPIRLSNPKILSPSLTILHMVDKYLFRTKAEYIIAKNADIVLCVADEIAEGYFNLNKSVHTIPHAIPEDEFLPIKKERNSPLIGIYVGNIDFRIDFKYQKYLIEQFPNITFEFVGKLFIDNINTYGIFENKYKNVVYRGEQPFKKLKYSIQNADFCFVFKDINHPGNNISSHKMLQYFAQGKPIFTTKMTRYESIANLLCMDNDKEKMVEHLQNFIQNRDKIGAVENRIEYAKRFSFGTIIKKIETIIDEKR
jgi:hypothetical protein